MTHGPATSAFFTGLGLTDFDATPEAAEDLGRIVRAVVDGLMDVLRARQDIKNEFNLPQTRLMPAQNNPLKFSVDAEDALHNLFVKRSSRYLGPVEAFEDAFNDLRHHQVAELDGMQTAFRALLDELNPDHLQKKFDGPAPGIVAKLFGRLRYWDMYRAMMQELAKDPEATFRTKFGDPFARAYEAQLGRLTQHRRTGGR